MANKYGPKIINDGLVLCIDAAGDNKSYPIDGLDVEYLIVGGGGAGGFRLGGGGGAGGLLTGATKVTIATGTYSIVVGAGGASITTATGTPSNGSNSSFAGFSAVGGGGGGQYLSSYTAAGNGGSGGGASSNSGAVRGTGTTNQGYAGGYGSRNNITSNLPAGWNTDNGYSSGGGGGAGLAGTNGVGISINAIPGDGGIGKYLGDKYSNGLGENGWFAGGGGGQQFRNSSINAVGGLGGGGRGAGGGYNSGQIQYNTPTNAQANTGGGGGGGGYYSGEGGSSGSGGSGIVLIRYSGPPRAKGGDSIISHRGYTVHVFTSSGNFIVGETVSDLSTSKKYGTLTNMSSSDYIRGRSGYFSFDGSDQYIDCGVDNTLFKFSAGDSISVIAAVKATNINQQTYQAFFTIGGDANITRDRSYQMRVANYSGAGKIDAIYRNSSNTNWHTLKTNSAYVSNNQWIIIASTYTYGTGSGWKIYVNGNPVATSFNSGNGNENPIVNTNQIFVGIGEDANSTGEQWYGQIGFVQMYRSYLTADQILNNFNAVRGRYGL